MQRRVGDFAMINIYCDESCHLPNDNSSIMVIGGISCPSAKVHEVTEQIYKVKRNHRVYKFAEIKWTKVSLSKLPMYKALVDVFFDNAFLHFRGVIATGKKDLSLERFNLTFDDWYQRIYYLVLREMVCVGNEYAVYVDIKDSKGSEKIEKLKEVLNHTLFDFYGDTIKRIQLVRSDQIQVLQLADLIIGAVCYANRGLTSSPAKLELIDYIQERSGRPLLYSTPKSEEKFNLFKWVPQETK